MRGIVVANTDQTTIPSRITGACPVVGTRGVCQNCIFAMNDQIELPVDMRKALQDRRSFDNDTLLKTFFARGVNHAGTCRGFECKTSTPVNLYSHIVLGTVYPFVDSPPDFDVMQLYSRKLYVPGTVIRFEPQTVKTLSNGLRVAYADRTQAVPNDFVIKRVDTDATLPTVLSTLEQTVHHVGVRIGVVGLDWEVLLTLLTVMSANWIDFGAGRKRGWLETYLMGDTRTGKTTLVNGLVNLIGHGQVINGESSTLYHFLGKLQSGYRTNGYLADNHHGLLVVDEAAGMPYQVIPRLSRVRSDGVTELFGGDFTAPVRFIWVSNRKKELKTSRPSLWDEIEQVIRLNEDRTRLDLIAYVNSPDIVKVSDRGNPTLPNTRFIRDVWRDTFPVVLPAETVKYINDAASDVTRFDRFAPGLFQPGETVAKLSRLAVAVCNLYSFATGKPVQVAPVFAHVAMDILDRMYRKLVKDNAACVEFTNQAMARRSHHRVDRYRELKRLEEETASEHT